MLLHRSLILRLLSPKRSRRPPVSVKQLPNLRLFTQNTQLLLISQSSPRPQLPFLHPPSATYPPQTLLRSPFQHQLSRLLTTESKIYFKNEMRKAGIYIIYGLTLYALALTCLWGLEVETYGRKFPTPLEWALTTRVNYLVARVGENPNENKNGLVDWAFTGNQYRQILARLENPKKEGAGVQAISGEEEGEEDFIVEGVSKNGRDISSKSERWRAGYHNILMGLGRTAEYLDGWVKDTTRNVSFPTEVVIGPSNLRPLPVPYGALSAPLEENCVKAFENPEIYYLKILKTQGFSTRQRLDAALAYGDWLDFKGLSSSAEEAYDWALDIAMGALPLGVNNVVDTKTGVINDAADYISSNVLLATTRLAIHHAKNNNLATALPIFLSIVRATRKLPLSIEKVSDPPLPSTLFSRIMSYIPTTPDYPLPSLTGDERQTRSPYATCEEAAIMVHIGEILFASSKSTPVTQKRVSLRHNQKTQSKNSGLSWTRDAVDLAESTLIDTPLKDREARKKCAECLEVGIDNWSKMVSKMLKDEQAHFASKAEDSSSSGSKNDASSSWTFLWRNNPLAKKPDEEEDEVSGQWEQEAALVAERTAKVRRIIREEGVALEEGERNGGLWGILFG